LPPGIVTFGEPSSIVEALIEEAEKESSTEGSVE